MRRWVGWLDFPCDQAEVRRGEREREEGEEEMEMEMSISHPKFLGTDGAYRAAIQSLGDHLSPDRVEDLMRHFE